MWRDVIHFCVLLQYHFRLFWRQKRTLWVYFAILFFAASYHIINFAFNVTGPTKEKNVFSNHGMLLQLAKIRNKTLVILNEHNNKSHADGLQIMAEIAGKKLNLTFKVIGEVPEFNKETFLVLNHLNLSESRLDYRVRHDKISTELWRHGSPFGNFITMPNLFEDYGLRRARLRSVRKALALAQLAFEILFLDAVRVVNVTPELLKYPFRAEEFYLNDMRADEMAMMISFLYVVIALATLFPLVFVARDFAGMRASPATRALLRTMRVRRYTIVAAKFVAASCRLAPISVATLAFVFYQNITEWPWRASLGCVCLTAAYALCTAALVVALDEVIHAPQVLVVVTALAHLALFVAALFFVLPNPVHVWRCAFAALNPVGGLALGVLSIFALVRYYSFLDMVWFTHSKYMFTWEFALAIMTLVTLCLLLAPICLYSLMTFLQNAYYTTVRKRKRTKHTNISTENLINLQAMTKRWRSGEKILKGINLVVRKGNVTALLGENGSGKSTIFACLSGNTKPTSGVVEICGRNLGENAGESRPDVGYCPQANPTLPYLSVYEHIILYFRLRTRRFESVADVRHMIGMVRLLALTGDLETPADKLSGGTKRKLFVLIALVGNPRVVLLDEPTAGMDPMARKQFRELIQAEKSDKAILISTHYINEAEILGEKIAVLADGKVACHDAVDALKRKFLNGLTLTIVFVNVRTFEANVHENGRQRTYGTNASEKANQQTLKAYRAQSHTTRASEDLSARMTSALKLVRDGIRCDASSAESENSPIVNGNELKIVLPFAENRRFGAIFKELEARRVELGIASFKIAASLEEVFININETANPSTQLSPLPCLDRRQTCGETTRQLAALIKRAALRFARHKLRSLAPFALLLLAFLPFVLQYYRAGVRPTNVEIDRAISLSDFSPAATVVLCCDNFSEHRIPMAVINLRTFSIVPAHARNLSTPSAAERAARSAYLNELVPTFLSYAAAAHPYLSVVGIQSLQDTDILQHVEPPLAVGICMERGDKDAKTPAPSKFVYSRFLNYGDMYALNAFTNTLLFMHGRKGAFVRTGVTVRYTPAELAALTNPVEETIENVADAIPGKRYMSNILECTISATLFAFVYCTFAVGVVAEQSATFQHQIFITRTWKILYFAAELIANFVYFAIFLVAFYTMAHFFWSKPWRCLATVAPLFTLCHTTTCAFVFCVAHWFESPAKAFGVLFAATVVFAPVLYVTAIVYWFTTMYMLEVPPEDNRFLNELFVDALAFVFPTMNIFLGLLGISYTCGVLSLAKLYDMSETSAGVFMWALVYGLIGYGTLLVLLKSRVFGSCMRSLVARNLQRLMFIKADHKPLADECGESARRDGLCVERLYKFHGRRVCAVHDLSIGVRRGECFALLGANGAGKTSAFNVISAIDYPSFGRVSLCGKSLTLSSAPISYCPQFDALMPYLTGRETLEMFGHLNGIEGVGERTQAILDCLGLLLKADKLVRYYSGGQKRRLSMAVALMAAERDRALLVLDEPTAGIDPRTRRRIWELIGELRARDRTAILLTTHSMEECEVLCTRVGFMHEGCLVGLGTSQQLLDEFVHSLTLSALINASSPNAIACLNAKICETFCATLLSTAWSAAFTSQLPSSLAWRIPYSAGSRCGTLGRSWATLYVQIEEFFDDFLEQTSSGAFGTTETAEQGSNGSVVADESASATKGLEIVDFSLTQSSMDQVFENLAKINSS